MNANGLTSWGTFLLVLRGVCVGVLLSDFLRKEVLFSAPEIWITIVPAAVFAASLILTPVLRALGWRRLVTRADPARSIPRPGDVERALRATIHDGLSLREAVRFLHRSREWDVPNLYPGVEAVANLPPKAAIRLVLEAIRNPRAAKTSPSPDPHAPPQPCTVA